jgi:hypothetical protein
MIKWYDISCATLYVRDGVHEENKFEEHWNKNMFELAEDRAEWRTVRF